MNSKTGIPDTALVAYLVGGPLALLGLVAVFVVDTGSLGAALILGGILFVCTGMLVSAISRR
ncbi:hypothetical protein [Curtobacterium aetherium]|uniref:Uncharacterized protein n=1 Tax=Curtobacterium aetherium TaxID=2841594 RepID=A0ACD1E461_9MICO|nr:hypothetical protein [Curtobacterium sp. L6-1]QWS33700.1 hypothetical protein KM842_00275 [Curtobacterium sp. L6-1]